MKKKIISFYSHAKIHYFDILYAVRFIIRAYSSMI